MSARKVQPSVSNLTLGKDPCEELHKTLGLKVSWIQVLLDFRTRQSDLAYFLQTMLMF